MVARFLRPGGLRMLFMGVLALCASGCESTLPAMLSQPKEITADGPYTHRPSKMTFPKTILKYTRRQILQYDVAGETLTVGYESIPPACSMDITLNLYNAPSDLPIDSPPQ